MKRLKPTALGLCHVNFFGLLEIAFLQSALMRLK